MRTFTRHTLAFLAVLSASLLVSACASDGNKKEETNQNDFLASDSIPVVIKNVFKAVDDNDASGFAREVAYPLRRPYPLKDIPDAAGMTAYYPVIVDDSLRNVILHSTPSDWQQFGWRGYSLHDGEYLWIDGSIYAINYVSAKEKSMIDSLTRVEVGSLPKELQKGWKPILTLLSAGNANLYRIDEAEQQHGTADYRLSIYHYAGNRDNLFKSPASILDGDMSVEGSACVVSYRFKDNRGNEYIIFPDDSYSGSPSVYLPDGSQEEVTKAYWHELIR